MTGAFLLFCIRAYDWIGRHVGYVANPELPIAWNILRSLGRHSVRGRAEGCTEIGAKVVGQSDALESIS
jgi:hypothetical protein